MKSKYSMENLSAILWDFDGVLMNSMSVRDSGFQLVLKDFPKSEVDLLMEYHRSNGGLSRYVKFRYFFEKVRNEEISENVISDYAKAFSEIMLKHLCDRRLLIDETIDFVKGNYNQVPMYIVSGSDQTELRFICKSLNMEHYFKGIFGSPVPKKELVKNVLLMDNLKPENCILIGDSINDFEAADLNNIQFMAYNNASLEKYTTRYVLLT